jgi:hypothetical protein
MALCVHFVKLCESGDLENAQIYYANNFDINIHVLDEYVFRLCCGKGKLNVAKWLYELGANIHAFSEDALKWACQNGHLDVIKWLYKKGAKFSINNNMPFVWSCLYGHLEVAQWIHFVGHLYITSLDYHKAFRVCCTHNHLKIAKWIYGLGGIKHDAHLDATYKIAKMVAISKKNDIITWLCSINPKYSEK